MLRDIKSLCRKLKKEKKNTVKHFAQLAILRNFSNEVLAIHKTLTGFLAALKMQIHFSVSLHFVPKKRVELAEWNNCKATQSQLRIDYSVQSSLNCDSSILENKRHLTSFYFNHFLWRKMPREISFMCCKT